MKLRQDKDLLFDENDSLVARVHRVDGAWKRGAAIVRDVNCHDALLDVAKSYLRELAKWHASDCKCNACEGTRVAIATAS